MFSLPMFERTLNIKRIELVFSVPLEGRCLIVVNKYFRTLHFGSISTIIGSSVKFVLLSLNITEADCRHILKGSDNYMAE